MQSPARFKVIAAGRRSGKTEIAKRDLVRQWLAAPAKSYDWFGIACAPTRDQAKAIYWEDLKERVSQSAVAKIRETDLTIQHVDGPILAVVGMDKPARAEGRPIDCAKVDEFADMKPGVWSKHLRPALDTDGRPGTAWIYGVSRPSAEFQHLATYAQQGIDKDWEYFWWPSSDILAPEAIEAAKRELDENTFRQEYGAEFVLPSGRAYYTFDRNANVRDTVPYDKDAPLLFGFDFNVEPGSAVVLQDVGPMTYVLGEVRIPRDSNTPAVCRRLIEDWGAHRGPIYYYGDPTGGNRGTAKTQGTDWVQIADEFRGKFPGGAHDRVDRRRLPERDRVNALNARMRNAAGEVKLHIKRDACTWLIRDLENMLLKEGTAGELWKERDLSLGHWADGLGYVVNTIHPLDGHTFTHTTF